MRALFMNWSMFALLVSFFEVLEALSPSTTPEQIVLSQLAALQKDDMIGVYEYASPNNKQRTGDINTFSQMVRLGPYKHLIGHKQADILMASTIAASKQYLVRVFPGENPEKSSKRVVEYWWS